MKTRIKDFLKSQLRTDLPEINPGDRIKIWQKITIRAGSDTGEGKSAYASKKDKKNKEEDAKKGAERISPFEGIVIAKKHGKGISATMTVRGEVKNVIVEKIFPIHSPTIHKIEILSRHKIRQAKLYFLRTAKGKRARLKRKKPKIKK